MFIVIREKNSKKEYLSSPNIAIEEGVNGYIWKTLEEDFDLNKFYSYPHPNFKVVIFSNPMGAANAMRESYLPELEEKETQVTFDLYAQCAEYNHYILKYSPKD